MTTLTSGLETCVNPFFRTEVTTSRTGVIGNTVVRALILFAGLVAFETAFDFNVNTNVLETESFLTPFYKVKTFIAEPLIENQIGQSENDIVTSALRVDVSGNYSLEQSSFGSYHRHQPWGKSFVHYFI